MTNSARPDGAAVVRVWAAIGTAAATKMAQCSSQGVPEFPVTALPVSPQVA